MVLITAFVVLVFVYSLVSKRREHTISTAPIVFTAAGVLLIEETHVPGEETIKLAVMVMVMLGIFAHGFSALPGIALYTRKVARLEATSPENRP